MPNRFSVYAAAGFAAAIIPILPPDAILSSRSAVDPKQRGKIPGHWNAQEGAWAGMKGWTQVAITPELIAAWDTWPQCNVGLRARDFPALDIDVDNNPELVKKIILTVCGYLKIDPIYVRGRAGSSRCLMPFRLKREDRETPPTKSRVTFTYGEKTYAVEFLGDGQQYLVEGMHPSGKPYQWLGEDLLQFGAAGLPEITGSQARELMSLISIALVEFGCVVTGAHTAGSSEDGFDVRDATELRAGDLEELARALRTIPIAGIKYDRYISIAHAAKAASGADIAFFEDVFLPWSLQYPNSSREWIEGKWNSVTRSTIGGEWLYGAARAHGFRGGDSAFDSERPSDDDAVGDGSGTSANIPPTWSDAGLRNRFVMARADDIRYCAETGSYYLWTGKVWKVDPRANTLSGDVQEFCSIEATTASRTGAVSKADRVANASALRGVVEYLKSTRPQKDLEMLPTAAVCRGDFNRDKYILNVQNGIVDLRTGILFPHTHEELCTLLSPVEIAPTPDCPAFLAFINQTFGGAEELIRYVQVAIGYTLLAERTQHLMFFIYGPTGTGKSTFIRTCEKVLGPYCAALPIDSFLKSKSPKHPADLAYVADKRMVITGESPEGAEFDVARLKAITGQDTIAARLMHQDYFEYRPDFAIWCASNHKPHLPSADAALRRRFRIIPFLIRPPEPDFDLEEKLAEEAPGILRWMVDGAVEYLSTRFPPCAVVTAMTDEYFSDEDRLGIFLADRCVDDDTALTPAAELFSAWQQWNTANGYKFWKPAQAFGGDLHDRGYDAIRAGKRRLWHRKGLRLKPPDWDDGAVLDEGAPDATV